MLDTRHKTVSKKQIFAMIFDEWNDADSKILSEVSKHALLETRSLWDYLSKQAW